MRWILVLTLMASFSLVGCHLFDSNEKHMEYDTVSLEVKGMT